MTLCIYRHFNISVCRSTSFRLNRLKLAKSSYFADFCLILLTFGDSDLVVSAALKKKPLKQIVSDSVHHSGAWLMPNRSKGDVSA
jgi:hypothetical protein